MRIAAVGRAALAVCVSVLIVGHAAAQEEVSVGWKVLLPDGQPAQGAMALVRTFTSTEDLLDETRVETGADGTFAAEAELNWRGGDEGKPDYGFFLIDMPGCALVADDIPVGNLRGPQEMRLQAEFTFTGQVIDEDKQPVEGAHVQLGLLNHSGTNFTAGRYWLHAPERGLELPQFATTSGADGTFELRGITYAGGRAAIGQVMASKDGARSDYRSVNIKPDAPPFRITVKTTISVSGTVVHALTGEPVQGASVRPIADPGGYASVRAPAITDDRGRFEIADLPPAKTLYVEATHDQLAKAWTQADPTRSTEGIALKMRPFATIAGRVIDHDSGAPPPVPSGLWLSANYDSGMIHGGPRVEPGIGRVRVSADGAFEVQVAAGTVRIGVSGRRYKVPQPLNVDVPPEGLTDLTVHVKRQPGYLVRFETDNPAGLKGVHLNYLDDKGVSRGPGPNIVDGVWAWPANEWGAKLRIRVLREKEEIVPWTEITADPDVWPLVMKVP